MQEIEKMPASEQETKIVIMVGEFREYARNFAAASHAAGVEEFRKKAIEAFTPNRKHMIDRELYENSGGGEMCEICGRQGKDLDDKCITPDEEENIKALESLGSN